MGITTILERITINNDCFWDVEFKEGGGFLLLIFVNCLNFCNKYYLYNSKNNSISMQKPTALDNYTVIYQVCVRAETSRLGQTVAETTASGL